MRKIFEYGAIIRAKRQEKHMKAKDLAKDLSPISTKIEKSKIVGHSLAKKIKNKKIDKIIYDRNGYRYHGRVKALAEAIREKGVNF